MTALLFDTDKNYLKISNYMIDEVMPSISANAWRVLCYMVRQTRGWGRDYVGLTYTEIKEGTGIKGNATLSKALSELKDEKYILEKPTNSWQPNAYALNRGKTIEGIARHDGVNTTQQNADAPSSEIEPLEHCSSSETEPLGVDSSSEIELDSSSEIEPPVVQKLNDIYRIEEKEKTVVEERAAAAAVHPDPYKEFSDLMSHYWGHPPATEFESEIVGDWCERVSVEAWAYALGETTANAGVGRWKYLEKILKRLEIEGYAPESKQAVNEPVEFTLEGVF